LERLRRARLVLEPGDKTLRRMLIELIKEDPEIREDFRRIFAGEPLEPLEKKP